MDCCRITLVSRFANDFEMIAPSSSVSACWQRAWWSRRQWLLSPSMDKHPWGAIPQEVPADLEHRAGPVGEMPSPVRECLLEEQEPRKEVVPAALPEPAAVVVAITIPIAVV